MSVRLRYRHNKGFRLIHWSGGVVRNNVIDELHAPLVLEKLNRINASF